MVDNQDECKKYTSFVHLENRINRLSQNISNPTDRDSLDQCSNCKRKNHISLLPAYSLNFQSVRRTKI